MSAPATPVIQGARSVYQPTDSVSLYWYTGISVISSQVKIYDDGELVSTQAATGQAGSGGVLWEWSATASSLAAAGSTVTVMVTASNVSSETSAPASVTFGVYAPPTVTLTPAEGATITGLPLTVSWSVDDPTGVAKQMLRIYGSNIPSVVYSTDYSSAYALDPARRSLTLNASDLLTQFVVGEAYKVRITVTNGVGLVTTVTHEVTVSWVAPSPPTLTNTTGDAGTASVLVRAAAPLCDVVVWRVIGDERLVVGEGTGTVESVDVLPPLGVDVTYEATATDPQTGAVSDVQTRTVRVSTTKWALNFGADASELLLLYGNPRETYGLDQGGAAYHFADGGAGRGLPVWYGTTDRDVSGTTTFDTVLWHDADRLQELCDQHDLGWLRDPHGHRRRVHMSPKVSHGVGEVWQVTVSWDEMRWEEPING